MKNSFKQIVFGIITVIVAAGCDKAATNVKIPPVEKKIVVQCFISPDDDIISALLSWSKPIIGTKEWDDPEIINNANVEISDGNKTVVLLWNSSLELYQIDSTIFKINAGKKYFLTVTMPDGKKVKANCEVPPNKNTTLTFLKHDTLASSDNEKNILCSFNYRDHEPSHINYFRLDGQPIPYNPYIDDYVRGEFKRDTELQDNNLLKVEFYYYEFQPIDKVAAWIINCDYNYFMYHKTLQTAQNDYGFFTEPSIIYTNIEGGLGCFGGYNSFEIEVNL